MTDLLVKAFVKNYENTENQQVRTEYGVLSSVVGVVCNVILFLVKISIGLLINSISVMADAFNNLSDAASSIISFVGVKLANRPADKEHPFGHGRYEYISALVVAFLVLQVGFSCMQSAVDKILHPALVSSSWLMIGILSVSVFLKVWLGFFNRKLGKRINSSVMKAAAADAFGDVLITSATVISVAIGHITSLKIDGYMGFIVSLFVLYSGFNIVKDTLEPLIGEAATPEVYDKISNFVESYDGILGTHDLIVHNYGPSHTMATIHAEISRTADIVEAHETIDRIEQEALKKLDIFLVIHMDPIEANDERVMQLRREIDDLVKSIDEEASIHDFRMVDGEHQINLIFDMVVPHSYKEDKKAKLEETVRRMVAQKDKRYQCVITVEHSYVAR